MTSLFDIQSRRGRRGFTLIEVMVVVAIIGIVISIAMHTWMRQREMARARRCQEQLMKIDGAKEQYALDMKLGQNGAVGMTDLVGPTAYLKFEPVCSAGGDYEVNNIGADPTCSYGAPSWSPPHAMGEGLAAAAGN